MRNEESPKINKTIDFSRIATFVVLAKSRPIINFAKVTASCS